MEKVDVLVIGAGIIGAAVARAFVRRGRSVILVEQHLHPGTETSSRNSQVIHAGIYYPSGSLKGRLCVEGKKMLYDYCRERGIPHRQCGKLIVATQPCQIPTLLKLQAQAQSNGVMDTRLIHDKNEIQAMEPQLETCIAALHSPSTGILDSHALLQHLLTDSSVDVHQPEQTSVCVMNARVTDGRHIYNGNSSNSRSMSTTAKLHVQVDHELWLDCTTVVNCAGLYAPSIANLFFQNEDQPERRFQRHYFAKGNYFRLNHCSTKEPPPFSHLIYPIPEPGGLGIHATFDLSGSIRFGPDVEWIDPSVLSPEQIDLRPTIERKSIFYDSIRQYWSAIPDGCLEPDYAGIRPKLHHPDVEHHPETIPGFQDFWIEGNDTHGIKGLINLLGIESPGLTSSLAIAEYCTALDQGSSS
jgi:L-2-hydroxyglutarate oxidase LhgO